MYEGDGGRTPAVEFRLMTSRSLLASRTGFLNGRVASLATWRVLAVVSLVALSTAGCLKRGSPDITGSLSTPQQATPDAWRQHVASWGPRFEANPADPVAALQYARGLRALDQKAQAVAVLQQAAIRSPKNPELLAAYGKALAEVGRYKEASEVLSKAHTPERPDWRILSVQGTVADQTGDHDLAQNYYETALKLAPEEPSVLSNLGLSYALSKRLPEAEKTLRQAADNPKADARVHQNLALVLSLQGKFPEAEAELKRDLSPEEADAMMADLRGMAAKNRTSSKPGKAQRS
jgi:Flp pilus assembly protein TadD